MLITINASSRGRADGSLPMIHDGLGGKHAHGSVVDLPDDVAGNLISAGLGHAASAEDSLKAKAAAEEKANAARQAHAARDMALWDSLPPDVRARAAEEGDGVVEDYLAGLPQMTLEEYEQADAEPFVEANAAREPAIEAQDIIEERPQPPKKRRGRPRKNT